MKKIILLNLLLLICIASLFAQETISEGTINYSITITNTGKNNAPIDSAKFIVYLKGNLSRTDMISSLGSETTIADTKTDAVIILKEYSAQKLMITLTKENWVDKYGKYNGITFQPSTDTKKIAGYICKKAIAKLKNGTTFFVFYAPEINVINKEYDPIFKDLPGLPIQYEVANGKLTFEYTLLSIDFNPLPAAKFETPKSGYRVMANEEHK